ncbi:hypothetical protein evm_015390 [Chilo suppressalis]|nr:hypothetical protein evm_015390 [Chilo suppressalis]
MAEINKKIFERTGETFRINTDDQEILDLLDGLPVKDDAGFDNFNEQLKINHTKQAMMRFFKGFGGQNVRNFINNMLKMVLMDEVALMYSLTGIRTTKKAFVNTEVFKLIYQLCKTVHEDVKDAFIKEIIGNWLNQAKLRLTRRGQYK